MFQAPGENLLGELMADEYHLGIGFFARHPWFTRFRAHHHMYALEQHTPIDPLQIQDALVPQQIGPIDLHDAAEEFLEAFRIERLVRPEHERAYAVVVMGVVMVSGVFFVLVNLVIDVLVGFVDPRVRIRGSR